MFPVITFGPFTKWGEYFMTCHSALARGNRYIIMVIDYFTKWVEALPRISNDCIVVALFIFYHIIARFDVPKNIVMEHGSHFLNKMTTKLVSRLGFRHENSTPYYPQENGQVKAINHVLKIMI
jgi:hypothetical protein